MGYSNEMYAAAAAIIGKRHKDAVTGHERRREEISGKFPELSLIEHEMAKTAAKFTTAILDGGNLSTQTEAIAKAGAALTLERAELLRLGGYAENYLGYSYVCAECEDTGFLREKPCHCMLELLKKLTYEKINAKAPLDASRFSSFDRELYSREPYDASGVSAYAKMSDIAKRCQDYAKSFSLHSNSLFLRGETGLGKTHLSLAIANFVIKNGYSVEYDTAPNLFATLNSEYFSRDRTNDKKYESTILSTDLLIIDDLGAEYATPFTKSTLYNIINSRILTNKPVIVSTNIPFDELERGYSKRITSRILGCYDILDFVGNDIRQIKKAF